VDENNKKINTGKKKILVFSLCYCPFVGGAEIAVSEITKRITEDTEFDMVTLRFDKNSPRFEKIDNVNIHRIGFVKENSNMSDWVKFPLKLNKIFFPIMAFWKASCLHCKNNYDAIWAIIAGYAGFSALFFKLIHPKIPYLLTLQEGLPVEAIEKRSRYFRPLFKMIFTKAGYIQAISNYLANWAKKMGAKCPVDVVPNGADINIDNFFVQKDKTERVALTSVLLESKDLGEWRKIILKDDYEEGGVYLITTSRLVQKNAVDDVIKSLKFLPENYKFLVLGIGPDREKLENLAEEIGVQNRVKFLGEIEYKKIPEYLAISDVFIRPSLSEGLGNSFLEAMAVGIPIIGTEVGGIPDFLKDKETGLFCEVRNPKDIAEKVKFILDPKNKELKKQIISNAKKLVIENYDWDEIAEKMKEIFEKLLVLSTTAGGVL